MTATSPVRYPDLRDPSVMTRRAWVLVVLNVLIPGSAQLLAGSRRLGRFGTRATFALWALVVIAVLAFALARSTFVTIATNPITLTVVQVVLAFYVVLWIVLTFDTLRIIRLVRVRERSRIAVALVTVVVLVGVGGAAGYAALIAGVTRTTVGSVFADGQIGRASCRERVSRSV